MNYLKAEPLSKTMFHAWVLAGSVAVTSVPSSLSSAKGTCGTCGLNQERLGATKGYGGVPKFGAPEYKDHNYHNRLGSILGSLIFGNSQERSVQKSGALCIDPKLLQQGHPQTGLPVYGHSHIL